MLLEERALSSKFGPNPEHYSPPPSLAGMGIESEEFGWRRDAGKTFVEQR